jgi:hypothetical protein
MVIAMNTVPNQVLEYLYQPSERKGVPDAIQVAGQWLQEIFKEPWWPSDSVHHLVHHGNGGSCDAVKITYRASDAAGPLTITVFQTLFLIVVTVARAPGSKLDVLTLGRRMFRHSERLRFAVSMQEGLEATGRQDSRGVPYCNYDWLDTIQWWGDEKLVGFEMLKRTGPGQGTIVRPELEANRTWFAKFE